MNATPMDLARVGSARLARLAGQRDCFRVARCLSKSCSNATSQRGLSLLRMHSPHSVFTNYGTRIRPPAYNALICTPCRRAGHVTHRRIRFARRAAEVDMSRMAWIGFDYDYTLAKYTSDLLPWYARALTALPNPGPEDQALSSAQDL